VVVPCEGWLLDRLQEESIEAVVLPERGSFDVAFLSRVVSLARRLDVDLIHSHLFGSAVRAGLASRLLGIPAVGTIHGQVDLSSRERYRRLKLAIVRNGLRRIVFVSEPLRRSCVDSMGLRFDRTTVINNGVDTDVFHPGTDSTFRGDLGVRPDEFLVGCVGRLQPVKGLEVLLKAAAILKSSSPGYRFVIVGDGDDRYTRDLFALRDRAGLGDDVLFTGFRPDIHRAMAAFDVYALTSHSEGFSLSTIEAMASGVPVVATRCGGPEHILEDGVTGLLVKAGSASEVAQAIQRLRSDASERLKLATAARGVVAARYTVKQQVCAYEDLYEQALVPDEQGDRAVRARPVF
jgi:glycosyltransferase involved in cell wall biosynthesis